MKSRDEETHIAGLLWHACESLRGVVTVSDALRYVAALVSLKLISDLATQRQPGGPDLTNFGNPSLTLPEELTWHRLSAFTMSPKLPPLLDRALEEAEHQNVRLRGAFSDIRFEKIGRIRAGGEVIISRLFEVVSSMRLGEIYTANSHGRLSYIAETLLAQIAEAERIDFGGHYVPPRITTLIASLMSPSPYESIFDPACGSGSLLCGIHKHVEPNRILGQDWHPSLLSLCKVNMLLSGVNGAAIEAGNALTDPMRGKDGRLLTADVVICNPPFGLRNWGQKHLHISRPELFSHGLTPRCGSDMAFLSHVLEIIKDRAGRAAVIVSTGALFRQEDRGVRKHIVENNFLTGVIVLPPKLFTSTKIQVAILLLDKSKQSDGVVFIDASQSYESGGKSNRLPEREVQRITEAARSTHDITGFSRVVRRTEIQSCDFSLAVSRYVNKSEAAASHPSLEQLASEIRGLEAELADTQNEIDNSLKALGLEM